MISVRSRWQLVWSGSKATDGTTIRIEPCGDILETPFHRMNTERLPAMSKRRGRLREKTWSGQRTDRARQKDKSHA